MMAIAPLIDTHGGRSSEGRFSIMTKASQMVAFRLAWLTIVLATAFYAINRAGAGKPEFYVWEAMSGKAHAGRYADINGVRIYYKTYSSGRPVLVLHGGLGFIEIMHYQIRALAANRFVIAPDSRGHGRSTDSDAPLSYALMADDMLKLLDSLSIDKADIVGWSDGGIIGLDLAMHHPDRVGRLVTIGANYDVDGLLHKPVFDGKIPPAPGFYRRNAPGPAHWPVLYTKIITMQQTQPHYSLDDLGKIKAPTLVMAGEFDVVRREHTNQLAKAIPNGREDIIKAATHNMPLDEPEVVNAHILQFLEGHP
jgi:pimeloyl-ACP methyl ester carboxylesterase